MLGNEAIARGALEAGVEVATSYPGTPATEVLEYLIENGKSFGVRAEWAINEKVAFEIAYGAAICGARSMTSMKHVGLNVASDPLITAAYTGVEGGFVVVVCDDPDMHSSQNEQDSRVYCKLSKLLALIPSTPSEAKQMCVEAFDLSEKLELPVILRSCTRVSHAREPIVLGEVVKRQRSGFRRDPQRYVMLPAFGRIRHRVLVEKQREIREYVEKTPWNRVVWRDTDVAVVAVGSAIGYARDACKILEAEPTILEVRTYPPPMELLKAVKERCEKIVVLEDGEPLVEEALRMAGDRTEVFGKLSGGVEWCGEITPEKAADALADAYGLPRNPCSSNPLPNLPPRPPVMCSGCPHRTVLYALKKLRSKKGLVVAGDIGCYTLGALKPLEALDTTLCMGASIGTAIGISYALGEKVVAAIGDSTFFHAGIPALVSAVWQRADVVVVIFDNLSVAMTGHQPTPEEAVELSELVKGCGVSNVYVVNSHDLEQVTSSLEDALSAEGPAVVICRAPCSLKASREPPPEVVDCSGCGVCVTQFGCPAIELVNGIAKILEELCVGCRDCVQVCPRGAIR